MDIAFYQSLKQSLPENVKLVAVSKTKPVEDIMTLYNLGQRVFGENKAQELQLKHQQLPKDIEWHFIGHLQTNKIKYIAPFVSMIHSIDSFNLLTEVNKFALKNGRIIPCLLQFHVAAEETKFGFNWEECEEMMQNPSFSSLQNVDIRGVMGMATLTDDTAQIRREFHQLHDYFNLLKNKYFADKKSFTEISCGMTDDYPIAIEEGSTMIRIGSAIFGKRIYQ